MKRMGRHIANPQIAPSAQAGFVAGRTELHITSLLRRLSRRAQHLAGAKIILLQYQMCPMNDAAIGIGEHKNIGSRKCLQGNADCACVNVVMSRDQFQRLGH